MPAAERNLFAKERNERRVAVREPLIVALCHSWYVGGSCRSESGSRGPQYIHEDVLWMLMDLQRAVCAFSYGSSLKAG